MKTPFFNTSRFLHARNSSSGGNYSTRPVPLKSSQLARLARAEVELPKVEEEKHRAPLSAQACYRDLLAKDGFLRLALAAPRLTPAAPQKNALAQVEAFQLAEKEGADIVVFPALSLHGHLLGDLSSSPMLLEASEKTLLQVVEASKESHPLLITSTLIRQGNEILPLTALIRDGQIAKFWPLNEEIDKVAEIFLATNGQIISLDSEPVYLEEFPHFPIAPLESLSQGLALHFSLDADWRGQCAKQRRRAQVLSEEWHIAVAEISPSIGESSSEALYNGYRVIAEAGEILAESERFSEEILLTDIDTDYLQAGAISQSSYNRQKRCDHIISGPQPFYSAKGSAFSAYAPQATFTNLHAQSLHDRYQKEECLSHLRGGSPTNPKISSRSSKAPSKYLDSKLPRFRRRVLLRDFSQTPFLPQVDNEAAKSEELENILSICSLSLAERMKRIHCKHPVLGLSGGLDSCLALLISMRAVAELALSPKDVIAVSMPGPASSTRTKNNAEILGQASGVDFRVIPIHKAVDQHLKDLGHDGKKKDVTYENAQARERTQILMDLANQENGIVIGSGDMSENALGWSTYNGDQMSMYSVNANLPKTLIRALCAYEAKRLNDEVPKLAEVIIDVVATPVSPELLPGEAGEIAQETEELIGPYELHDFFLWHLLVRHSSPGKILRIASHSFSEKYSNDKIRKTLQIFLKRFIQNQFKRSASPDAASISPINLSPRSGLMLPSDLPVDSLLQALDEESNSYI